MSEIVSENQYYFIIYGFTVSFINCNSQIEKTLFLKPQTVRFRRRNNGKLAAGRPPAGRLATHASRQSSPHAHDTTLFRARFSYTLRIVISIVLYLRIRFIFRFIVCSGYNCVFVYCLIVIFVCVYCECTVYVYNFWHCVRSAWCVILD